MTTRPILRGYVHQAAVILALIACSILLLQSHGTRAIASNIIYSISLVGLYTVSALYHSPTWGRRAYSIIGKIDHSAIFILIAGSATPVCLLGIKGELGTRCLTIIWILAIIGIFLTVFWFKKSKLLRALLYVATGWVVLPYMSEITIALGMVNIKLLITGGVIYTLGAFIYAFKWPNPFPRVFGYHEIFHVFVVIASGYHFMVIYNLTTGLL